MSDTRMREGETHAEWDERVNGPARQAQRERMEREDWEPAYETWRHGGSYVVNIVFPGGGCGCIVSARNTLSGKFESACFPDAVGQHRTRREAAYAEREHAMKLWREHDAERAEVAA